MFLAFVAVGVLTAVAYNLIPGEHHLRYCSFAIGLAGAWFGGYFAAAFIQGTFVTMGWVTLVGSIVGAIVHIAVFEAGARAFVRHPHYQDLL